MEHKFITISSNKVIGRVLSFNQALIAAALNTSAGKSALAKTMAQPIARQLGYAGIARRALNIQQLQPTGLKPDINIEPKSGAMIHVTSSSRLVVPYKHDSIIITPDKVIGNKDRIILRGVYGRRVTVPEFEISSNPTVKISDIKSRRFSMIDRYTREVHGHVVIGHNKRIGIWNKIQSNGFSSMQKAVQKAKDEIMAQEDAEIFRILDNI